MLFAVLWEVGLVDRDDVQEEPRLSIRIHAWLLDVKKPTPLEIDIEFGLDDQFPFSIAWLRIVVQEEPEGSRDVVGGFRLQPLPIR